jgi:hypothetical protein
MDFATVEEKFRTLKLQFLTGALDEASFKAQLEQLMVQDEGGRWWMIGYETGHWYVHDGAAWERADPPRMAPSRPVKEEKTKFSPGLVAAVEKAKLGGSEPVPPISSVGAKAQSGALPRVEEVKKMGWGFWLRWLGAAGVGGAVFIAMGSDYQFTREIGYFWVFVIPGSIIGVLQWLIMRGYVQSSGWWAVLNSVYMGMDGAIMAGSTYPNSYNSTANTFALILFFAYPVLNLTVGPIWVARKRQSS